MALILKDRVLETTHTGGTGTVTLLGAQSNFLTFSSAIGNGNTTYYTIVDDGDNQWEVGIGTVGAGTLSRDTVLSSSNSGNLVNFGVADKQVFCDYPASKSVYQDSNGLVTVPNLATNSACSLTPVLTYNASNSAQTNGATVAGSYLQNVMQNKSGTAGASTNYVISNDLGTDSTYYGEFGINSSVFSASTPADYFSLNNGIYYSGHDGDISIGSGNGYKTYFAWGTTGQSAHVINATGALGFSTNLGTTPALSGTTGFGTAGQVLSSNGSASAPTWVNPSSLATAAGGSNTQVQYNSSGALAGSANLTFNGTTLTTANDALISGLTVGKGGGAVASNTVVGSGALNSNTTGTLNAAFGQYSLVANTTGSSNIGFGWYALGGNTTGSNNTAVGDRALFCNTTASNNTAVGYQAGFSNTTGTDLVFIGYQSGYSNTTGNGSTSLGIAALNSNTTGSSNTCVGSYAVYANTTGAGNSGFGASALLNNTTGASNVALGTQALYSNTTASNNTAVGFQAGYSNTTGTTVTYIGAQAGYASTGNYHTAVGYQAGYSSTSGGDGNSFFGIQSGQYTTTGDGNVAAGGNSLRTNTTGSNNTSIGTYALFSNTTASYNTAVGYQAGYSNTTAQNNTIVGYQAQYTSALSPNMVSIGYQANYNLPNTTGNGVSVGYRAGYSQNSSNNGYNTFIGYQAGTAVTTAYGNCFVGSNAATGAGAGGAVTTGNYNTIIGGYDGNTGGLDIRTASNYIVLSDGAGNPRGVFDNNGNFGVGTSTLNALTNTNAVAVNIQNGYEIINHASGSANGSTYVYFGYNAGVIGSITQAGTTGVLYNITSDYRLKTDVTPIQNALTVVEALNPVHFTWVDGRPDDGFLAHEIQTVLPNCVTGEKDAVNEDGTPKYQQMDNSGVIPFLVKAIQELNAKLEAQAVEIATLKGK